MVDINESGLYMNDLRSEYLNLIDAAPVLIYTASPLQKTGNSPFHSGTTI